MPTSLSASLRVAAALLLAAAGTAQADTLAPAGVAGTVSFNLQPPAGLNITGFGDFPLSGPGGLVQLSAAAMPSPFLRAQVDVGPNFTGRSSAQLIYQMQVVGPAQNVGVHVAVAGSASGSSNTTDLFSGFAMKAQWRLEDVTLGLAPVFSEGIDSGALQGSFNQSFGHVVDLTLVGSHIYRVTLVADAFAAAVTGPSASASAYIDPVFSFAAGVGQEYSFQFSEGIGNAPVPEPSALLLLAAGLAVLGWRRQRAG